MLPMQKGLKSLCALALLLASVAATPSPKPVAGGAMQRSSVEGCMGAMLFNGVWRLKVLSVDPAASYNDGSLTTGIGVRVQVRNGTSRELAPDETGFSDINGRGIDLAFDDENTSEAVSAGTNLTEALLDKKLPPGAATTLTIYFPYSAEKNAKPVKLLVAVDPHAANNYAHVKYSVKNPSFRVHLDCSVVH